MCVEFEHLVLQDIGICKDGFKPSGHRSTSDLRNIMWIKGPSFLQSEFEDYYEHESSPLVEVDMFKEIRPYVQVAKTKMNVSDNEYKLGSDRFL